MRSETLTRLWGMRLTFALVVCIVLFFQLLPLQSHVDLAPLERGVKSLPPLVGPDMLLCFAFAWSLRRPEYVPAILLAALFLMADLLLQRPPGPWSVMALIACEKLKGRAADLRDSGFASEWATVCLTLIVVAFAYRAALMITLLEPPPFGVSLVQLVMTMLCYPLAVGITHWCLGVRKASPGGYEAGGGPA